MSAISRKKVIMPAGIELTFEAEKHIIIRPETKILSLGSGTGELEAYLVERHGCSLTGIDINPDFVEQANENSRQRNLSDKLAFEIADARETRFEDKSFDIVFASGSLSSFFDRGADEISRVLKDNGKAVIIDAAIMGDLVPRDLVNNWLGKGSDIKVFGPEEMRHEFQKRGFKTILSRVYYEPFWWEAYYSDRGNEERWVLELKQYLKYREYIGIGIYIFTKDHDQYEI